MSEYQYYEFQALDKPLTKQQQKMMMEQKLRQLDAAPAQPQKN